MAIAYAVGDGWCDDFSNNVQCNFDGGDCCSNDVKTDWCIDCLCLEPGLSTIQSTTLSTTVTANPPTAFTTNNYPGEFYLYCLSFNLRKCKTSVLSNNLTLDCPTQYQFWIGDGYCDDESNVIGCGFDGGDCCLQTVATDFCTECKCLETGC